MPKGIYYRNQTATKKPKARQSQPKKLGRPTTKASTAAKPRGPGRPPNPKAKPRGRPPNPIRQARAPRQAQAKPRVRAQGAAPKARQPRQPQGYAAFAGLIQAFGKLLDQRSKLLIEAMHGVSDAIREGAGTQEETATLNTTLAEEAKVSDVAAEDTGSAGEASVS